MILSLGILVIVTSILFFVSGILVSEIHYNKKKLSNYSLRNYFPSELFISKEGYFFSLYFISSLLIVPFCIALTNNIDFFSQKSNLYLIVVFSIICEIFLFLFIYVFKIEKTYKQNLFCFTAFAAISISQGLVYSYVLIRVSNFEELIPCIFGVATAIIGIICIFFLINPKLFDWFKMNVTKNSDGEVTVSRPKYFVLAYTQWICIISQLVMTILFILGIIFFIY